MLDALAGGACGSADRTIADDLLRHETLTTSGPTWVLTRVRSAGPFGICRVKKLSPTGGERVGQVPRP